MNVGKGEVIVFNGVDVTITTVFPIPIMKNKMGGFSPRGRIYWKQGETSGE